MKYRIKLVRYADEREEFYVETKGILGWSVVHTIENYDDWVPMRFDVFEDAKAYILRQLEIAFKQQVISTEIVFETEGK